MQPPDIANLTIPGGLKIFFDQGTGMLDLGFMTGLDCAPRTEEFKHESNRSGQRRVVKTFTIKEELMFSFKLHDPVVNHMLLYFKGGTVESVGEGTDNATDEILALMGELLHSVAKYGISAVTVRQFVNKVFLYDGSAYNDHSIEADSEGGSPFTAIGDADDYLYIGKDTKFQEIYFDLETLGDYGSGVTWEYWDGSAWSAIVDKAGAGVDLAADGPLTHTPQTDWTKNTVNGYSAYWLRASAGTVNTPATVNCIRQDLTQNTDYIVDPGQVTGTSLDKGRIGRLAAGKLVDGEEVKVSYTYTTWTSLKFPLATTNFKEGAARIEVHPGEGKGLSWNFHIPKCQMKPDGNIAMGEDTKTMDIPMQLEVLDDSENNPDAPYGYWEALSE